MATKTINYFIMNRFFLLFITFLVLLENFTLKLKNYNLETLLNTLKNEA